MELKEAQDELIKLKLKEEFMTVEYTKKVFGRHKSVLDLSNHYIFENSCEFLCNLLKRYFKKKLSIKALILQNCMLSFEVLNKILKTFQSAEKDSGLRVLDLGNNRLAFTAKATYAISELFSKVSLNKAKSIILQGNILQSGEAMEALFSHNFSLLKLNLYDSNLSSEALLAISDILAQNRSIQHLNLGFNSQAFLDHEIVSRFAISLGCNRYIEELILSGNESLSDVTVFEAFCKEIHENRSLNHIALGGIGFGDSGITIIISTFLNEMPLSSLDLQNNHITEIGFCDLIDSLPEVITSLDVSYNNFNENSALFALSALLLESRSLRKLNISHSVEIENLDMLAIEKLCESLTQNDSLSEFICEGVKISEDPDEFCRQVNEAIANRKLSLTYKVSAVNCFTNESTNRRLDSSSVSHTPKRMISNVPSCSNSAVSREAPEDSNSQTERKEYVDSLNQELSNSL
ncbi:unnamed protein product [Blepharisma stoltei]|uniref:Ran GTPase-activating protein n=1 Tax=Blepharisma stoltei TaxID=1481888 RepID=A0AAU9I9I5_9CILI|nr:unnamed protein product [Blepharisma stoltei]